MSLKTNINKIHSDLSSIFDNVEVFEKSSLEFGEYVELKAVNENKELVMIVTKRQLENDKFNWSYYSNPIKKDFLVERVSTVDGLLSDIKDIFEKNRFDSDYTQQINN